MIKKRRENSRDSVAHKSTISYSNKTREKSRSGSRNRPKSKGLAPTMSFGEKQEKIEKS